MTATGEFEHFTRLCHALKPWLGEIVIVGGWAHRLYRLHEWAQPLDYQPLITLDTDVAVPKTLPMHERNIAQRLHEYGFIESFLGDRQPPVTQYRLGPEQDGFYAEFLTPLLGSGYTRDGKPAQTTRIAGARRNCAISAFSCETRGRFLLIQRMRFKQKPRCRYMLQMQPHLLSRNC